MEILTIYYVCLWEKHRGGVFCVCSAYMNDGRDQKIKRDLNGGILQQVENIFLGLLESAAGIKVSVRKGYIKYCRKRGIFEAV